MNSEGFIVAHGRRSARVAEFPDAVGLQVGEPFDLRGMALPPAQAVALAGHLLDAAAHILDRQLRRQAGSP